MGYTTEFSGIFKLEPALSHKQWIELIKLTSPGARPSLSAGSPDAYLQWKPTKDGEGLEWDGGEKFYEYVEWLQWLIDNRFTAWGIKVSGEVRYQGEEIGDVGILAVRDGKVYKEELSRSGEEVTDEDELSRFMDEYGPRGFLKHYRVTRR